MSATRLWHDDVRPPPVGWKWARRNEEAIEILLSDEVVEISLDHDMGFHDVVIPSDPDEMMDVLCLAGNSEQTGMVLVDWMIANDRVPSKITIHSWNYDRARAMAWRLAECGYDSEVEPYKPGSTQ